MSDPLSRHMPLAELRRQVEERWAQCRWWIKEGHEHHRLEDQFRHEVNLLQMEAAAVDNAAELAVNKERLMTTFTTLLRS